jgi:hypothetical protein
VCPEVKYKGSTLKKNSKSLLKRWVAQIAYDGKQHHRRQAAPPWALCGRGGGGEGIRQRFCVRGGEGIRQCSNRNAAASEIFLVLSDFRANLGRSAYWHCPFAKLCDPQLSYMTTTSRFTRGGVESGKKNAESGVYVLQRLKKSSYLLCLVFIFIFISFIDFFTAFCGRFATRGVQKYGGKNRKSPSQKMWLFSFFSVRFFLLPLSLSVVWHDFF